MAKDLPQIPFYSLAEVDLCLMQGFVRTMSDMPRLESQVCRDTVMGAIRADRVRMSDSIANK